MTLRGLGARIIYARRFPDHHVYSDDELQLIGAEAVRRDAEMVVVTHKDAVKVRSDPGWPIPLYYLAVELELVDGADAFWKAIDAALETGDERRERSGAG
jgi:tetraacyldisaccharide 4'-kinase